MDFFLLGLIVVYTVLLWRYVDRKLGEKIGAISAKLIASLAAPMVALAIAIPFIPAEGEEVSFWSFLLGLVVAFALSFLEPSVQRNYKKIKAEEEEKERQKLKRSNLNYRSEIGYSESVSNHSIDDELFDEEEVIGSISFKYQNANGDASDREVDIFSVDDNYFEGFCHLADGERTFRIDRIEGDVIDLDTGQLVDPHDYFAKLGAIT